MRREVEEGKAAFLIFLILCLRVPADGPFQHCLYKKNVLCFAAASSTEGSNPILTVVNIQFARMSHAIDLSASSLVRSCGLLGPCP